MRPHPHPHPPQTTFRKSHKTSIMCDKRKTTTKTPSHTSASRRQHTSGFEDELRGLRENGDFGSAGLSSHFLNTITNCVWIRCFFACAYKVMRGTQQEAAVDYYCILYEKCVHVWNYSRRRWAVVGLWNYPSRKALNNVWLTNVPAGSAKKYFFS